METKFKVWNGKLMLPIVNDGGFQLTFGMSSDWSLWDEDGELCDSNVTDAELLQWTGLYDDHGEEIYKGDIVELIDGKREHISEVRMDYLGIWVNTHSVIKEITGKEVTDLVDFCDYGIGRGITAMCMKVGNIYENPELLETK